jgi:alanine dehydrogenase
MILGVPPANDVVFGGRLHTLASNGYNIERAIRLADLVIGCVLIPGAAAPRLATRAMVAKMKKDAVIVDGVVHYCVTNMPAAVPHTSILALTNSTFPYLLKLANLGANAAIQEDAGIAEGVNTFHGTLTCKPVADSQHREWQPIAELV